MIGFFTLLTGWLAVSTTSAAITVWLSLRAPEWDAGED